VCVRSSGVVASLRDVAAARLTGATTGGEDAGPHHLEVLPSELQALVAHKALLNDPATRRYFQVPLGVFFVLIFDF